MVAGTTARHPRFVRRWTVMTERATEPSRQRSGTSRAHAARSDRFSGRPQVTPTAEGWKQPMGPDGRPTLQFAQRPRVSQPPAHLADMTMEERQEKMKELGLPAFRAKQVSVHYFQHHTTDPEKMSDLPKDRKDEIVETFFPPLLTEVKRLITDDGKTIKFLWRLFDGALVESVLMRYSKRITLCISSQCGCGMNCPFCATGQNGLTRNMSTAEILDQIVQANRIITEGALGGTRHTGPDAERVNNIVFMGMGEPLANYDNVVAALQIMLDDHGYGLSRRRVTLSTSGLVPAMDRLREDCPVALAVSLHAPNDALRDEIVPINKKYPLRTLLAACDRYLERAPRDFVTFEYVMLDGINDTADHARQLLALVASLPCKFNLIPFNPFPSSGYARSKQAAIRVFRDILQQAGYVVTVRKTRGEDIDAACGQLAGQVDDKTKRKTRWLAEVSDL